MTKYLKQNATVERAVLDSNGKPKLDVFGQPIYKPATRVKCRKEPYVARAATGYGQYVNFTNTYYFDESVTIKIGDVVDGHVVQSIADYVDGLGNTIGWQVDV